MNCDRIESICHNEQFQGARSLINFSLSFPDFDVWIKEINSLFFRNPKLNEKFISKIKTKWIANQPPNAYFEISSVQTSGSIKYNPLTCSIQIFSGFNKKIIDQKFRAKSLEKTSRLLMRSRITPVTGEISNVFFFCIVIYEDISDTKVKTV